MVKILGRSLHGSDHWDCVSKVCEKGQEKKKAEMCVVGKR